MPYRRLGEKFKGLYAGGGLASGVSLGAPSGAAKFKLPSEIVGLTGWWDASDANTLYTDAGVTKVSASGDLVYRMTDKSGGAGNRYMEQATAGDRMTYRTNRQNGLSGLESVSTDIMAVTIALSNFIANNEAFFLLVMKTNSIGGQLLNDPSLYIGIQVSAANTVDFRNWDGNYDNAGTIAFTNGVAFIVSGWHSGGNIYIQKNNNAASAGVASGNTTTLTGLLTIFRSLGTGDFYEACVFNQTITAADRALLIAGLMAKWGIT